MSFTRQPHAVVCSIQMVGGGSGRGQAGRPEALLMPVTRTSRDRLSGPLRRRSKEVAMTGVDCALTVSRDQVIPSITAVIAAPTTATVAANTVKAAANHRSRRSRRARGTITSGKVEGIAGRISARIVDGSFTTGAANPRQIQIALGVEPDGRRSGCATTRSQSRVGHAPSLSASSEWRAKEPYGDAKFYGLSCVGPGNNAELRPVTQ